MKDNINFDNNRDFDIAIYEVGKENCVANKNIQFTKKPCHMLHYVVSGTGTYVNNGKRYDLKKGDMFYISPFAEPNYYPSKDNPWSYIWVGFDGECVKSILNHIGLSFDFPIYHDPSFELRDLFNNIALSYYEKHQFSMEILGNFYLILDKLVRKNYTSNTKISMKEANVLAAKEFIRNNYQFDINVVDIANSLNLSPNYLANIFQEIDKTSPKQYLIDLRMNKAVELLSSKNMKIKDVASLCGYPKQLHFSSEFKKRYGVSPKEYKEGKK